jgi:bacterioferritin-associated ferredoxin
MVDRCICFSKTFAQLKDIAVHSGTHTVSSLQALVEFGYRCGLCKPYVQRMLESGHTAFPVMPVTMHPFEDPALFGEEREER